MKPAEKTALYRELAKLTQADFHLDRSLELLLSQKSSPGRRAYLEGLQKGLAEGRGLAESLRTQNGQLISGLEIALTEAGERSGKLSAAFNHLARYFASEEGARRQMRQAMIYPLILLHLAIVLPEIPTALTATEGPGFATRILIMVGILWAGLAVLAALWGWLVRQAPLSPSIDACLGRVPWIGKARRHWALARFCQVFHAGLLAALRMSEICRLAGEASQSARIRHGAAQAAETIKEQGEKLSLALAETGAFPSPFVNAVATAEEVGKLDEEMARWNTAETVSAAEAMERAAQWLPKAGYALVVGFVMYRIFTMVQGYYGSIRQHLDAL